MAIKKLKAIKSGIKPLKSKKSPMHSPLQMAQAMKKKKGMKMNIVA